jgi:peptidoglycan hydrolase-like amidase
VVEPRLAEDVELIHTRAGLVLVNDVSMLTYVEGIAEVPVSWPIEALKAQAVAARTYAWRAIEVGTYTHYDICATVACQVFHGRDVVEAPNGDRWVAAVAETEGEVLLHDDAPILARYFSTSGGETRNNEDVYPSDGPYPYLVAVDDPEDEVSPLHRWRVRFTREEMDEILSRGAELSAVSPLGSIEVIPAGDGHPVEIMDLTFAIQALCAHRLANGHASMENKVHLLPSEIDDEVAAMKLDAVGMGVDELTREQKEFLAGWRE